MIAGVTFSERPKIKIAEGVLETIGNTPLVRLRKIADESFPNLFAKMENFNPGGSIKDRPALYILKCALEDKVIDKNTTIIESSSGNMGIGLAQACTYLGLKFICVVDKKTTKKNVEILRVLGADVKIITEPDPETGEYLQSRIKKVKELLEVTPNSFWTNQYSNINNANAHYDTASEIINSLDGNLDYLFCATSSCGTIRGVAEYVNRHNPQTKIIGVDAVGSAIFGHKIKKRIIPGHGSTIVPPLLKSEIVDDVVHVTDWDCVVGCRKLIKKEGILVGGSSGAVMSAAEKFSKNIRKDANCVLIFPDRGERYFDTIYSDKWVNKTFGKIPEI